MTAALKPVTSSLIAAHGYDLATRTLAIRFKPNKSNPEGAVYHYADVAPEAAEAFDKAESVGKHFGEHIRGKFSHRLIETAAEHEGSTTD